MVQEIGTDTDLRVFYYSDPVFTPDTNTVPLGSFTNELATVTDYKISLSGNTRGFSWCIASASTGEIYFAYNNLGGVLNELKKYAEILEDEIEKMPEISKCEIKGALEREIRIDADIHKMDATMVNFGDIMNAIAAENITMSGGNIRGTDFQRSLRGVGEFSTVPEIEDIVVSDENGKIVYLRDVAEVRDSYEERVSYSRSRSLPVVTVDVVKRAGENLIIASDKIKDIVAEVTKERFPDDLNVSLTNDMSKYTRSMVDNLQNSIISGVILVTLTLMFFMGLRNSTFVGIAIPLSMFMSFMILSAIGYTANMMVLMGLILALGMLVDNGIVVVENIYRLMQEGYSPIKAAKEGVGEVAMPIITSTVTTLAAFFPLVFWKGIMGEFMKYLPMTLIIVLASSLFVALVINPVLTSMYMKLQEKKPRKLRLFVISMILLAIGIMFDLAGIPLRWEDRGEDEFRKRANHDEELPDDHSDPRGNHVVRGQERER